MDRCPFAPGAAGNLATKDLDLMVRQCGLGTGIDLAALLGAAELAQELVGYPIDGRSMRWLRSAASGQIMDKEKNR